MRRALQFIPTAPSSWPFFPHFPFSRYFVIPGPISTNNVEEKRFREEKNGRASEYLPTVGKPWSPVTIPHSQPAYYLLKPPPQRHILWGCASQHDMHPSPLVLIPRLFEPLSQPERCAKCMPIFRRRASCQKTSRQKLILPFDWSWQCGGVVHLDY